MDAIGVELREAMKEPGCPVCRLLQRFEGRTIEAFLYEHPTDPELRRALVEAVEFLVGKAGPERSDGRRRLWRLR